MNPVGITSAEMAARLNAGDAVALGCLPSSPVRSNGTYWRRDDERWLPILDPELLARLRRDERRLALADAAITSASSS